LAPPVTEIIGFIAAATSTLCWFPQSIRTIRTRDTSGISLVSQSAYTGAIVLWAIYGILIESWPLILSNIIQLFPLTAVLWIKVVNELAARRSAP
jgi:MtN3 and saliva related transmembrane protein